MLVSLLKILVAEFISLKNICKEISILLIILKWFIIFERLVTVFCVQLYIKTFKS